MSQEQIGSWWQIVIETMGGAAIAFVGLVWRMGRRDKEIDLEIATASEVTTEKLHEQRLYIDERDYKNYYNMTSVVQQETAKTEMAIEKLIEKLEYHEGHDDKRFSELIDRISNGFKDLSDRIADLRVQVAIREAQRIREVIPRDPKQSNEVL